MMSKRDKRRTPAAPPAASTMHEGPTPADAVADVETTGEPYYWPEGKPMPTSIVKPKPVPCPACRRVRLDTMAQACIIRIYEGGVCYLRCRACQHRFKLPIARGS